MHRNFHLSFVAILITLVLVACRNEPKAPQPVQENIVTVRMSSEPENLNFLLTSHTSALETFKLISMPLANFDPSDFQLAPTLIKAMPTIQEVTEGDYKGTTSYDFEILEEAKWDNGTPITAADFLFTLKAVFNPSYASPHRSLTSFIKGVEIDEANPKKYRVYGLKNILATAVVSNFELMPRHVYDPEGILENYTLEELKDPNNREKLEKDEQLKAFSEKFTSPLHLKNPAGISYAGPYKVESWAAGQQMVLVKKENWWGDALVDKYPLLEAKPEKIIFKFIPDINAAVSLAKNGEVDLISRIEWTKFVELQKDKTITDNYNLYVPDKFAYRFIILNNANPKLSDKKVRQALDHLFNREEIGSTVYYGNSTPIIGPVHPGQPFYNKALSVRNFSVEKAKSLLEEAGWKDSNDNGIVDKNINGELVELEIALNYANGYQDYASMGVIFADAAREAGVSIVPTSIESNTLFSNLKAKDFDASFFASDWYPLPPNLGSRYHTRGGQNFGSYSNAEVDKLISAKIRTVDESEYTPLYLKIQEILHDETPNIFINTGEDRIIVHKKFGDIRVSAVKPHYYLNEFSVKEVPVMSSAN